MASRGTFAILHSYSVRLAALKTRTLCGSFVVFWYAQKEKRRQVAADESLRLAGRTGLEPATSGVTGRRSNQLNYRPRLSILLTLGGRTAFPESGAS